MNRRRSLRKQVFERDGGVCCECAVPTEEIRLRLEQLGPHGREAAWKMLEKEGFVRYRSLWDGDHRLALDEGGKDELENVVTRCRPCHKGKTSEQATRKAFIRKVLGRKFVEDWKRRTA